MERTLDTDPDEAEVIDEVLADEDKSDSREEAELASEEEES